MWLAQQQYTNTNFSRINIFPGKFRTDAARKETAAYLKYSPPAFLHKVAKEDADMLHKCRTKAMFLAMANLVYLAWVFENQEELAKVFGYNYLFNEATNDWFYAVLQEWGFLPQNNSLERIHLEEKGSKEFAALIKMGLSQTRMMNTSFPKLVYIYSLDRVGVRHEIRVLDEPFCITQDAIDFAAELDRTVDMADFEDGVLVNTEGYLRIGIDAERKCDFKASLEGKFELTFELRAVLHHRVASLCHVTSATSPDGRNYSKGTCFDFMQHGCCTHAVAIQYETLVSKASYYRPKKRTFRYKAGVGVNESKIKRRRLDPSAVAYMSTQKMVIDFNRSCQAVAPAKRALREHLGLPDPHVDNAKDDPRLQQWQQLLQEWGSHMNRMS